MDHEILEDIGLTGSEIKVFIALLEVGSSSAGKIVEKSGLQNAVVHRAFHSLAEKGLITYILEGKIKQYQAIEPKLLLSFLDEKREKLKKVIPELEAKKKLQVNSPQATIFQGFRGVKELLALMIEESNVDYYAYGGPVQSHDLFGDFFWESHHNKRIEKNINAKLIFHSELSWWAKELNKRKKTKVRLTKDTFEEITETIIVKDKVAIIIYAEKPFGFLIKERKAALSYKKFFEIIWNSSKLPK
jgi:sugar-specific transcriptional regulator TrmB